MTKNWLDIIGVPEAGIAHLPADTRGIIEAAETVFGPQRFLDQLDDGGTQNLIVWQTPFSAMLDQIFSARHSQAVILATGDPNWFGIGATLSKHLNVDEYVQHASLSSFQLAASRLKWALQNITTLSLHGRQVEAIHPHVLPGNRVLALTSDANTALQVAQILIQRGFGKSQMIALQNLGRDDEAIASFMADEAHNQTLGDFYVLAIDCVAEEGAPVLSTVPGLPDDAFVSDGQLTKREVRAATLAKLAPYPDALLWDVGAGSGSVAIEWMRSARNAKAICFERDVERCKMITENRNALGVPKLDIVTGEAPNCLSDQPAPDAIFIGGDVGNDAVFEACFKALKPNGRLVANAVTLDGEEAIYRRHKIYGGDLARIETSVFHQIGNHSALKPRMAVTQWSMVKGSSS